MRRRLRIYVWGVIAAGGVAQLGLLAADPPRLSAGALAGALLLTSLIAVAYVAPLTAGAKRRIIPDTALHMLAIATLPLPLCAAVGGAGAVLGNIYLRRPAFNTLFNAAQVVLSLGCAAGIYRALTPTAHGSAVVLPALLPAGVALYLVSTLAVDGATALQRGRFALNEWLPAHATGLRTHALLASAGIVLAPAVARAPWLACIGVAPVLAISRMLRARLRFEAALLDLAEELAVALTAGARAAIASGRPLSALATAVALRYGMSEADSRALGLAVRIHQLHAVTFAPGEGGEAGDRQTGNTALLRRHPAEVAEVATHVFGMRRLADTLRFHHERFDGRGEPFGLVGKDIPLGARIFAASAAYTALRAASENRPALDEEKALLVLRAGAGTAWDPDVVRALCAQVANPQTNGQPAPARAVSGARAVAGGGA